METIVKKLKASVNNSNLPILPASKESLLPTSFVGTDKMIAVQGSSNKCYIGSSTTQDVLLFNVEDLNKVYVSTYGYTNSSYAVIAFFSSEVTSNMNNNEMLAISLVGEHILANAEDFGTAPTIVDGQSYASLYTINEAEVTIPTGAKCMAVSVKKAEGQIDFGFDSNDIHVYKDAD